MNMTLRRIVVCVSTMFLFSVTSYGQSNLPRGKMPKEAEKYLGTGLPDEQLQFVSPREEFPPRPKGYTTFQPVPWKEIRGALTDEQAEKIVKAALDNQQVRRVLGDRYIHLDIGEIEPKKGVESRQTDRLLVSLTFYSYSNNVAVEVDMEGTAVRDVTVSKEQPPETFEEVQMAVALIRGDPQLSARVANLEVRGILTPSVPGEPGAGDRLLYIMFRQPSGKLAYSAVVDMTTQKVLSFRASQR